MQNNKINVSELDFDQIKSNLKQFLQGQDKFSDYDFEGSGLAILLDVLAYNTHYNALYTNLAVNESFIDSASKRNSVVSLAKALGYVPDSAHGAEAKLSLTFSNTLTTPPTLTLPKYTQFTTVVDSVTYNFYTLEDYVSILDTNNFTYTFDSVDIKEGTPLLYKYEVGAGVKYIIPNNDVDISTVLVRIQDSATSSNFVTYIRNEDILELNADSKVYFLKEIEGEYYEIEFGNDVIGKALQNGNIVNIEYMTCAKSLANGAKTFTYQGSPLLGSNPSVVTLIAAAAGVDKEDIDTIRYNAPRAYTTQNRGVTVNDYRSIILTSYGEAQSVNIWGGEDNLPPVYGQVFIAIKPKTTETLSILQKDAVLSLLKSKNVVTVKPVIVDPEYINIEVESSVYYNPKVTNRKLNDIKTLVIKAIEDYNAQYLDSFEGIFRFSKFSSTIDNAEDSIVSNITTLKLRRRVEPKYNLLANYDIELGNPIYASGVPEQSIISTGFYTVDYPDTELFLEDYPTNEVTGQLRMYYVNSMLEKVYVRTLGTVTYATGSISISGLNIVGITSEYFEFIIKPQSNDVVSIRNQLVSIPSEHIIVNVVTDKIASGDAAGNSNYTFTSSRN